MSPDNFHRPAMPAKHWLAAINKMDEIGAEYEFILSWRMFVHRIHHSDYKKAALLESQEGICPVCGCDLDTDFVLHHLDYAHTCEYGIETKILSAKVNSRTKQPRFVNAPDCERCHKQCRTMFDACDNRLVVLHEDCHRALHGLSNRVALGGVSKNAKNAP